jgi:hypothetical protein
VLPTSMRKRSSCDIIRRGGYQAEPDHHPDQRAQKSRGLHQYLDRLPRATRPRRSHKNSRQCHRAIGKANSLRPRWPRGWSTEEPSRCRSRESPAALTSLHRLHHRKPCAPSGINVAAAYPTVHKNDHAEVTSHRVRNDALCCPPPHWRPRFATETLSGQRVALNADPTQDSHDRYGRSLAYVVLADGRDFSVEAARAAAARTYVYDDKPVSRYPEIKAAEDEAQAAHRCLWGPPCTGHTDSTPT